MGTLVAVSFGYLDTDSPTPQEVDGDFIITFLGDTHFGENIHEQFEKEGKQNILKEKGYDYTLEKVKPILLESDFVIANLETPITDMENSPLENSGKKILFWADIKKTPEYLKKYNITAVSLGNNHALDYGQQGLIQTIEALNQSKIDWFGAGLDESSAAKSYNKVFEVSGENFTLAVIGGFQYLETYDKFSFYAKNETGGVNKLSGEETSEQIKLIKKELGDDVFVVVFPHWGANYSWKYNKQSNLYHQFIDAGADLIIGHGAHRLQEIEKYNDKWILYSLGNFVFNSEGSFQKYDAPPISLVAQLVLDKTSNGLEKSMRLYPIFSDNKITNYQTHFLDEGEFDSVYRIIVETSPTPDILEKNLKKGQDEIGYFIKFPID